MPSARRSGRARAERDANADLARLHRHHERHQDVDPDLREYVRDEVLAHGAVTLQYKVLHVNTIRVRIAGAAHPGMCFGVRDAVALAGRWLAGLASRRATRPWATGSLRVGYPRGRVLVGRAQQPDVTKRTRT